MPPDPIRPQPAGNPPIRIPDWPEVSRLFDEAAELDGPARAAWLGALDTQRPALAGQVRALLQAAEQHDTDDWLSRGPRLPPVAASPRQWATPQPGAELGRYRLIERCGVGGMGEVWLAQPLHGPQRRVALKLPLQWLPGSAAAERFQREGRILAALAHPHIARLYDTGTDADGVPHLALEWIEGQPLTTWCDQQRLDLRQRLQLFLQVLDAVAYAHGRLVLHRDLKPAHLLVVADAGGAQVKLLDFGIAKLLKGEDTGADATVLTQAAGRVMTPAYAAPEQVRGQTLGTAADLYALGVVLYELLSGHRPYAPQPDTPAQLEAAITEGRIVPPAERVSAADGEARGCSRAALQQALRGELGAVLDQALQLEPARRYPSAETFAADIRRYLGGHPVQAAAPGRWQHLRKFAARHRLGVALGSAAVAALLALTGTALWQAEQAGRARARALQALSSTEHVAFFLADLLGDALGAQRPESPAALVERAERIARQEFADEPETLARVLVAVAQHHGGTGDAARALQGYDQALALTRDPAQRQAIACGRGLMLHRSGRSDEAAALLRQVADDARAEAVSRSNCASYLATVLVARGETEAALAAAQAAHAHWRAMPRPTPQFEAPLLTLQASILMNTPRVAEAEQLFAQALQVFRRQGRDQGPAYATTLNNGALASLFAGQLDAARAGHDAALALAREHAPAQGVAPISLLNAAGNRLEAGQYEEAAALYAQTLQAARRWQDTGFAASAQCLGALARWRAGEPGPAQALLAAGRAEPLTGRTAGERIAAANCLGAAAQIAWHQGDAGAALQGFEQALAAPQLRAPARGNLLQWRARARLAQGDAAGAQADAEQALAIARALQGGHAQSFRSALALDALARAQAARQDAAAAATRAQADAALQATLSPGHWLRRERG